MGDGGLVVQNGELTVLTQNGGMDNVLKPLIKEIKLFDSYIAGTSYLKDKSVFDEIELNDKLVLKREDNKFDDKAIMIYTESGKKLGYVPEKDNVIFSRLMDAGKLLIARITSIKKRSESYTQIGIDIFLVDF